MYVGLFVKLKRIVDLHSEGKEITKPRSDGTEIVDLCSEGKGEMSGNRNLCSERKKIAYLYTRTMGG